jgi:AraC-like DNA-binding protein
MSASFIETNRLRADPRELRVRASRCPAIGNHHIAHTGIADETVPDEIVRLDLREEGSLTRLVAYCHLSGEHLRRLGRRELGRSPMNRAVQLPMQPAARLLTTANDKIEAIAHEIGYENPFVFSTTFKKWVCWRPFEHRTRQGNRSR